ncbi:hypothetical protein F5Y03DRAFT_399891 [Xylaria venustula]|nr:hypothetical protein F5Y03DRAFT_399891 [Xylaria venustula]
MAALIRGLALVGQELLRGDLLYILMARGDRDADAIAATYLDRNPEHGHGTIPPYIFTDAVSTEPTTIVVTTSITTTKTAAYSATSTETEVITITATQSTTVTVTQPTSSTEGATPPTPPGQEKTTVAPHDSFNCNFPLLYMGASLLPPPLRISVAAGLEDWEPAVRQLSEIRRLVDVNREALIKEQGPEELDRLHAGLQDLVEKPLKYGCSVLENLQAKLTQLYADNSWSHATEHGHRAKLADLLREVESELADNIPEVTTTQLLPSWARETQKLWSDSCPARDCFKIGTTSLDLVTADIPSKLLAAVRKAKIETPFNWRNVLKMLYRRIKETAIQLYYGVITFYKSGLLVMTILLTVISTTTLILSGRFWGLEYIRLGARYRQTLEEEAIANEPPVDLAQFMNPRPPVVPGNNPEEFPADGPFIFPGDGPADGVEDAPAGFPGDGPLPPAPGDMPADGPFIFPGDGPADDPL